MLFNLNYQRAWTFFVVPGSVCLLLAFLAGCSAGPAQDSRQIGDVAPPSETGHTHAAPHGGHLIELGDHAANLEIVLNPADGTVDLYVLDGHAEGYIRLPVPAVVARVRWAGAADFLAVELRAVANPLTGETAGDSSRFSAVVPQLAGKQGVEVTIPRIEIGGAVYTDSTARLQP